MTRPRVAARIRGRAALDARDREDARRGHPAVDLSAFARARGLEPLGSLDPSGHTAVMPMEPELQFNVVRGTVAGRDAVLWHWRYPWPLDDDGPAGPYAFSGVVSVARSGWRSFLGISADDDQYVGVPCTGVAALVPEAGLLPSFRIACGPGTRQLSRRAVDLGPSGLPGAGPDAEGPLPEGSAAAVARGPLGAVVRAGSRCPLFDVGDRFGTVVLRRNGYVADERDLDGLLRTAVDAGDALAGPARPLPSPRPFEEPLPASGPPLPPWLVPPATQLEAVHALARRFGLTPEDPRAHTAAFPANPAPGTAWAVLRGAPPGLPPTTRLALHTEAPVREVNTGRTALVLPAGDATPTPRGGVRIDSPTAPRRLAVYDGLWTSSVLRSRQLELGDVDLLLSAGADLARRTGALPG
ncbi:hypothetical protein SAMN05660657_04377 [Geodermatophilus amargosae]|uniref:Uncharacterized protein n=1 Tax=Geodermatophilus amargosae TaxID=1296565 RepID=A0A1I7CE25_9ACTN|nr:hypothetical protein [Geodermatophilus amargosae]SFT97644.1 hypothetical protein SAMN05660657_04377 [Geodermatophilus amargosae]